MEGAVIKEGITQDVKMYHGGGGPTGQKVEGDFLIQHSDGFKGAKRVAISVFNVAFPDENSLTANMNTHNNIAVYHNSSTLHTALQGVDQATRQRIADAAYANFVTELKQAGYEVVERFNQLDPLDCPGVLVNRHAPFTWGKTVAKAVEVAVAVECIADMALMSLQLDPSLAPIEPELLNKHFNRKHGPGAYYGQK